jgi:hypothetical protein
MSKKTDQTLNKCDELIERLTELKKAIGQTNVQSSRKPVSTLGAGWSQDSSTGALHHSSHGVISPGKQADGSFKPVHGGKPLGTFSNIGEAGKAMGAHARSLKGGDTGMVNRASPNLPSGPKLGTGNAWATKSEDEELDKSNYGPKGSKQYSAADNAKRKMNNTGDQTGFGQNTNTKAYSSKPGQLSAKQQAAKTQYKGAAGPVKQYTPEQIAAANEARKLKKNSEDLPWVQHTGVPNADAELAKVNAQNPVNKAEDLMANQLANVMAGRAMLGIKPPPQPTNEQMFGHLVPNEEDIQKADHAWNNRMNWLDEAVKPISARFNSPEEEQAYWDSIKVNTSSKDDYGF